jgi:hypothetical protein
MALQRRQMEASVTVVRIIRIGEISRVVLDDALHENHVVVENGAAEPVRDDELDPDRHQSWPNAENNTASR